MLSLKMKILIPGVIFTACVILLVGVYLYRRKRNQIDDFNENTIIEKYTLPVKDTERLLPNDIFNKKLIDLYMTKLNCRLKREGLHMRDKFNGKLNFNVNSEVCHNVNVPLEQNTSVIIEEEVKPDLTDDYRKLMLDSNYVVQHVDIELPSITKLKVKLNSEWNDWGNDERLK